MQGDQSEQRKHSTCSANPSTRTGQNANGEIAGLGVNRAGEAHGFLALTALSVGQTIVCVLSMTCIQGVKVPHGP